MVKRNVKCCYWQWIKNVNLTQVDSLPLGENHLFGKKFSCIFLFRVPTIQDMFTTNQRTFFRQTFWLFETIHDFNFFFIIYIHSALCKSFLFTQQIVRYKLFLKGGLHCLEVVYELVIYYVLFSINDWLVYLPFTSASRPKYRERCRRLCSFPVINSRNNEKFWDFFFFKCHLNPVIIFEEVNQRLHSTVEMLDSTVGLGDGVITQLLNLNIGGKKLIRVSCHGNH